MGVLVLAVPLHLIQLLIKLSRRLPKGWRGLLTCGPKLNYRSLNVLLSVINLATRQLTWRRCVQRLCEHSVA